MSAVCDAISVLVLCGFAPLRFSSVSVAVICIDSFICEILVFVLVLYDS